MPATKNDVRGRKSIRIDSCTPHYDRYRRTGTSLRLFEKGRESVFARDRGEQKPTKKGSFIESK